MLHKLDPVVDYIVCALVGGRFPLTGRIAKGFVPSSVPFSYQDGIAYRVVRAHELAYEFIAESGWSLIDLDPWIVAVHGGRVLAAIPRSGPVVFLPIGRLLRCTDIPPAGIYELTHEFVELKKFERLVGDE